MALYQDWQDLLEQMVQGGMLENFWKEYYALEEKAYEGILGAKRDTLAGTANELAEQLGLEPALFAGFCDGINTSLAQEVDLEALEGDTQLDMHIDWEKLYFNMRDAKAPWLYEQAGWDAILTEDRRREITNEWRASKVVKAVKTPGRNDPCSCGSGKKYKHCCG